MSKEKSKESKSKSESEKDFKRRGISEVGKDVLEDLKKATDKEKEYRKGSESK